VNAVSYIAVLIGLLRMNPRQIRRPEQPERHPPVLHSLREGFDYAVRTPLVLWCLVLLGGIAAFGFNFQILLPLFAREVLHLGPEAYGGLYAAMGVGSLSGSLALAFMRARRAIPLMLIGGAVFSVLLVGIGLATDVLAAAGLVLAAGFASMLMINTINATVQANVTDALRGRVMSFYVTVFAGSAPLGGLFAGAVAETLGTPAAFFAGAALSLLTVGLVALGLRSARERGSLGVTTIDSGGSRREAAGTSSRSASATR
jgi:predicted MFS family arabinose efflux permease